MPSYKVIADGFHDGVLYSPKGKRPVLNTNTPFKKCPVWLQPLKGESAQEKGARTKAENKAKQEAAAKAAEDKKAVDAVTFTTTAEQTTQTL